MSDAWAALRDGARRVHRAPAILCGVWVLTIVAGLQLALLPPTGDLPTAVYLTQETVTGASDAPLLMLLASRVPDLCVVITWLFVCGGVLDRFARDRATRQAGFFAASGVFFFRFLRLAAVQLVVYKALFAIRQPAAAFAAIGVCAVVADYARIRMIVEDRRSAIAAIAAAAAFIRRNLLAVVTLFVLDYAVLAGVDAVASRAVAANTAASMWSAVPTVAVCGAARLWVKLLFWASETALFQRRLAHAGYVARPEPVWPESPAAEAIV